jgi:hypothetical protein
MKLRYANQYKWSNEDIDCKLYGNCNSNVTDSINTDRIVAIEVLP